MTRVAVSGAAGAMGRLTCAAVVETDDLELTALFSPSAAGQKIAGVAVSRDPSVVWAADVVVEFTRPDVVMGNLAKWHELGVNTVVGTSGFDAARVDEVGALWGDGPARCLIVPNFSIGAVVAMRLSELAAPHFPVAEVIELHHDTKVDAPSGTALATAQRIGAVAPDQARAVEGVSSPSGALGADVAGVRVHSVRLPGLVAHQEVLFGGAGGETLSIRYDTYDGAAYMPGVLLAIRRVASLEAPVTVGLEGLLGI